MLITILFWYLVLTMGAGALIGAFAPIWGPFPAHGPAGLAVMGALLAPAVPPLLAGGALVVGAEFACDLIGRLFDR
jgi:hypothetical protein